ncbi:MAG: hypothetical protein U0528_16150 [Anaerolineae bacterium]|nr:hypothetical protein [Anaerolineae bacterium]
MTRTRVRTAATATTPKRYRPLGVSLAILFAFLFYGIRPLLLVVPVIWSALTQRLAGVDFIGGTWGTVSVMLGAFIVVASVFAWLGRPRGVRLIFIVLVWLATAAQIATQIPALNPPPDSGTVASVGTSIQLPAAYYVCLFALNIAIPLYVTWYLNRAPARAFYDFEVTAAQS